MSWLQERVGLRHATDERTIPNAGAQPAPSVQVPHGAELVSVQTDWAAPSAEESDESCFSGSGHIAMPVWRERTPAQLPRSRVRTQRGCKSTRRTNRGRSGDGVPALALTVGQAQHLKKDSCATLKIRRENAVGFPPARAKLSYAVA